jgi:hypothetical protein
MSAFGIDDQHDAIEVEQSIEGGIALPHFSIRLSL